MKIKDLWNRHLVMMEMGARCPSKFLAPKIEEFPRTNKHFCWKFGYTELWDTTTLPPKSCCLPLPCCQFLPEILWKTASAYIVTWSTFHRSPNGDASLKTAFMASNSRDEPFRKSTLTLKSSEAFWNIFSSYILSSCYLFETTCTSGNAQLGSKKTFRSWQRGFFSI